MVLKSVFRPAWVAAFVVTVGLVSAPASRCGSADDMSKDEPAVKTVELFAAMESGEIDVKLIPKNSKQATVLIENKGDQPLRIKLPDAFAGVPVLAQMGMGGMGGMGGGMGMGGMGGGMGVAWAAAAWDGRSRHGWRHGRHGWRHGWHGRRHGWHGWHDGWLLQCRPGKSRQDQSDHRLPRTWQA